MKVKYQMSKGKRYRKTFHGVTTFDEQSYWWNETKKCWQVASVDTGDNYSSNAPCNSVRAFRRMLRKMPKEFKKGTNFVLISKWVGYDVYGKN